MNKWIVFFFAAAFACTSDKDCDSKRLSGVCHNGVCKCRMNRWEADGTSSWAARNPTCGYTLLDLEPGYYYFFQIFSIIIWLILTCLAINSLLLLYRSDTLQMNLSSAASVLTFITGLGTLAFSAIDPLAARGWLSVEAGLLIYLLPLATMYVAIFIVFLFWRDMAQSQLSRAIRFGQGGYLTGALIFVWVLLLAIATFGVLLLSRPTNPFPSGLIVLVFATFLIGAACLALFYYVHKLQKSLQTLSAGKGVDPTHASLSRLNTWVRVMGVGMFASILYLLGCAVAIGGTRGSSASVRITVQIGFEIIKFFDCLIVVGTFGRGHRAARSRSNSQNASFRNLQSQNGSKRERITLQTGPSSHHQQLDMDKLKGLPQNDGNHNRQESLTLERGSGVSQDTPSPSIGYQNFQDRIAVMTNSTLSAPQVSPRNSSNLDSELGRSRTPSAVVTGAEDASPGLGREAKQRVFEGGIELAPLHEQEEEGDPERS